jgi:hypothetical protein
LLTADVKGTIGNEASFVSVTRAKIVPLALIFQCGDVVVWSGLLAIERLNLRLPLGHQPPTEDAAIGAIEGASVTFSQSIWFWRLRPARNGLGGEKDFFGDHCALANRE